MKILLLILALSCAAFGQKSVADLIPGHRAALEEFLSKNKNYSFMSEDLIDKNFGEYYLTDMRVALKLRIKPYYMIGFFNNDRIADFAVVLSRDIEPKKSKGGDYFIHPLTIVIFNGGKKGAVTPAFTQDVDAPLNCLLNVKGMELAFSVFGSDADTIIFKPVGKSYITERPKAR